jgi:acetyltransferase
LGIENLDHIFSPDRIAVIGASDRKGSIGAKILRNLIGVGYKGGVARLILDTSGNDAEFVVLVSDRWQGKGLGSKLVDSIIEIAQDKGVKSIYADVIYNNRKMLSLAKKKVFNKEKVDYDTIKIVLTLNKD